MSSQTEYQEKDSLKQDINTLVYIMRDIETKLTEKMEGIETKLTEKIESVDIRLTEKMEGIETKLTEKIESVDIRLTEKMEGIETKLTEKIDSNLRWTMGVMISLVFSCFVAIGILIFSMESRNYDRFLSLTTEISDLRAEISDLRADLKILDLKLEPLYRNFIRKHKKQAKAGIGKIAKKKPAQVKAKQEPREKKTTAQAFSTKAGSLKSPPSQWESKKTRLKAQPSNGQTALLNP